MSNLYSPLATDDPEIRLVTVFPSTDYASGAVHCGMQTVRLGSLPEYEALSYVWGDPTRNKTITVNDQAVAVTGSLVIALTAIRRTYALDGPFAIWVDALCINQQDIAEKTVQVGLMASIYRGARGVIGWLGEAAYDSDYGMEVLANMAWEIRRNIGICAVMRPGGPLSASQSLRRHLDPPPSQPRRWQNSWLPWLTAGSRRAADTGRSAISSSQVELPPGLHWEEVAWLLRIPELLAPGNAQDPLSANRPWDAIKNLFRRTFWYRIWILQEVVLARQLRLLCGGKSISWEDLCMISSQLDYPGHLLVKAQDIFPASIRSTIPVAELAVINAIQVYRVMIENGRRPGSHEVMISSTSRKATDPRDHVFALLGMASSSIAVDYSRPVEELYLEFSTEWIEQSRNGSQYNDIEVVPTWTPLLLAGIGGRRQFQSLPSWVVDLSSFGAEVRRTWSLNHKACGRTSKASAALSPCGEELRLRGAVVDAILRTARARTISGQSIIEKLNRFLRDVLLLLSAEPQSALRSMFRTLLLGRLAAGNRPLAPPSSEHDELLAGFLYSIKFILEAERGSPTHRVYGAAVDEEIMALPNRYREGISEVAPDVFMRFWSVLRLRTFNNTIFATYGGRLGVGIDDCQRGDVACIVPGHGVPLLLRPCGKYYQLVSTTYIDGLMDGEAVKDNVDAWLASLEDIEIH